MAKLFNDVYKMNNRANQATSKLDNSQSFSTSGSQVHIWNACSKAGFAQWTERTAVTTCVQQSSIRTLTRRRIDEVRDCKRQLLHTFIYVKGIETAVGRIWKKDWPANTSTNINHVPMKHSNSNMNAWCLLHAQHEILHMLSAHHNLNLLIC